MSRDARRLAQELTLFGRQARASEAKTLASSAFCTVCGSAEGAASEAKAA